MRRVGIILIILGVALNLSGLAFLIAAWLGHDMLHWTGLSPEESAAVQCLVGFAVAAYGATHLRKRPVPLSENVA